MTRSSPAGLVSSAPWSGPSSTFAKSSTADENSGEHQRVEQGARVATGAALPAGQVDIMAHMLLAALNEAALLIVRATDQQAALAEATEAVTTLVDRLATAPPATEAVAHR
jgi:hypothetical protein